jgi:phage gp36-like protein
VTRYAEIADRDRLGIIATAFAGLASTTVEAALDAASAMADGYLRDRYELPLGSWSDDLRAAVCHIASWTLLANRGYDPSRGTDEVVRLQYEDAMRWLRDVSGGRARLGSVVDATPSVDEGDTLAISNRSRGWQRR